MDVVVVQSLYVVCKEGFLWGVVYVDGEFVGEQDFQLVKCIGVVWWLVDIYVGIVILVES